MFAHVVCHSIDSDLLYLSCISSAPIGFVEKESPPLLKEDFLGDRPVNFNSLDGNVNPVLYKNAVPETCAIPPVLILIIIFVKNDFAIK